MGNVILVVMDSVSASHLPVYGYNTETTPFLSNLAKDHLIADHCVANSSWTVPSHGTLFTGHYPTEHGAHAKNKYFDVEKSATIRSKLAPSNHHSVGISANPWISQDFGFDSAFDQLLEVYPDVPLSTNAHPADVVHGMANEDSLGILSRVAEWSSSGSRVKNLINLFYHLYDSSLYADCFTVNNRIQRWLSNNEQGNFFMFINYMDAHEPYQRNKYTKHFQAGESFDITWNQNAKLSENQKRYIRSLYDSSLRVLDDGIERLFGVLDDESVLDESTVIITSDHGKCLGESGYIGAGTYLFDKLVQIPLIIKPGKNATIDSINPQRIYDLIDIHQICLSELGVDGVAPLREEGEASNCSLSETMGAHQNDPKKRTDHPEEGFRRLDKGGSKLIHDKDSDQYKFDDNGFDLTLSTESNMQSQLENWVGRFNSIWRERSGSDDLQGVDDSVASRLEKLGYK